MKILVVTYIFEPEPIVMSSITKDLAMLLSKENDVTVLRSKPCRPYGYKFSFNETNIQYPFNVEVLDSYVHPESSVIGRFKENISFGKSVAKYIDSHKESIDVIYMNAFPLFSQKIIAKKAKRYQIPVINHVEDIYPEGFRTVIPAIGDLLYKLLLPVDAWVARNIFCSVVIGENIGKEYIKTRCVDTSKVKVVYNWQDESRFKKELVPKTSTAFTFMYVGSISRAANLHGVLSAFISSGLTNAQLIFAGSGTEKESLQREAAVNPGLRISFIEAPVDKIAEIQEMADVLILPLLKGVSLRAFPSKFPAYLFSKKPILACVDKGSDVAQIVEDNECGWVVESENVAELAQMMKSVFDLDRDILKQMGINGYRFSQDNLTKEVNLKKLADIVIEAGMNHKK